MEVTYTREKVPNSFSRRMKLSCNTLTEHDKLKEVNGILSMFCRYNKSLENKRTITLSMSLTYLLRVKL